MIVQSPRRYVRHLLYGALAFIGVEAAAPARQPEKTFVCPERPRSFTVPARQRTFEASERVRAFAAPTRIRTIEAPERQRLFRVRRRS